MGKGWSHGSPPLQGCRWGVLVTLLSRSKGRCVRCTAPDRDGHKEETSVWECPGETGEAALGGTWLFAGVMEQPPSPERHGAAHSVETTAEMKKARAESQLSQARDRFVPLGCWTPFCSPGWCYLCQLKSPCTQVFSRCSFNQATQHPAHELWPMLLSPSCILQTGLPHLQHPLPTGGTHKPPPDPHTELGTGCSAPAPGLSTLKEQRFSYLSTTVSASPACCANCLAFKSEHRGLQQPSRSHFVCGCSFSEMAWFLTAFLFLFFLFLRGWYITEAG